ncbi:MAG: glutaredoxin family protein [Bacillus sp. (in: firmicutes)]
MSSITVYTTSRCPYCVMLKNFLNEQNISFTEINLENKPEQMEQLMRITGQMGVPQTEVNGKWVVGFDPNSIMLALKN